MPKETTSVETVETVDSQVDQQTPQTGATAPAGIDEMRSLVEELRGLVPQKEESNDLPLIDEESVKEKGTDSERPTGGLNDLKTEDITDTRVRSIAGILDAHYPTLDKERLLGRAVATGDPELIDLHYLRDIAGDQADLLQPLLEEVVNTVANGYEEAVNSIYEYVGGRDQWEAIRGQFVNKAPQGMRNYVRSLIDSQDPDKVREGIEFIVDYSRRTGLVDTPQRRLYGDNVGDGASLTQQQYLEEYAKLDSLRGNPREYNKRVTELRSRRARSIELGIK